MLRGVERYRRAGRRQRGRPLLPTVARVVGGALAAAMVVRWLLLGTFGVQSAAMQPAIAPGDRVLTEQLSYGARWPWRRGRTPAVGAPQRGDLVVVEVPYYPRGTLRGVVDGLVRVVSFGALSTLRLPDGAALHPFAIKRLLGLPEDTIRVEDSVVFVRPVGSPDFLSEYELLPELIATAVALPEQWRRDFPFSGNEPEVTLGPGEYFVMSDDRSFAADSRSWGPLTSQAFVGRVFARYWPLSRISGM